MKKDLDFVSGRFFDYDIPKEQRYLLKYFKTEIQLAFLRYFLVFGDWRMFREHTGHACAQRTLERFEVRYRALTSAYKQAKSLLTEEAMKTILDIETGKYSV